MRYAGALHLKVKRAVGDLLLTIKAQHPQYEGEEFEVVFLPVKHDHRTPMVFRLNGQTHPASALLGGEPDEMPEPAHAAAEEDGA